MSISVGGIIFYILHFGFLAFYIWTIVMFVKNKRKPKEERRTWPTVLFIVFTSIIGLLIVTYISFAILAAAIVANM